MAPTLFALAAVLFAVAPFVAGGVRLVAGDWRLTGAAGASALGAFAALAVWPVAVFMGLCWGGRQVCAARSSR